MSTWIGLTVAGVLGLAAVPADAQQRADVANGADVARVWCSNCHTVEARPTSSSDAVPSFGAIAASPGTDAASLHAFLAKPHGQMPDLKLTQQQMDDLVAYVLSLRR